MSIREDTEEFRRSGLQGEVRKLMKEKDEGYILIEDGGWRGKRVESKPSVGSGEYLYFKQGQPVQRFKNQKENEEPYEEFKLL